MSGVRTADEILPIELNSAQNDLFQTSPAPPDMRPPPPVIRSGVDAVVAVLDVALCLECSILRSNDPPLPSMSLHTLPFFAPASMPPPSTSTCHFITHINPPFETPPASLHVPPVPRLICARIEAAGDRRPVTSAAALRSNRLPHPSMYIHRLVAFAPALTAPSSRKTTHSVEYELNPSFSSPAASLDVPPPLRLIHTRFVIVLVLVDAAPAPYH
ncbi:hypothetical protein C8F01DRAFT_1248017 [Mycena amicta]|nr:hypothetical protein C8F01DRAFT_1248017 [Mycena amicta]